jgi:chloramphenicol-sensitive protein RarD
MLAPIAMLYLGFLKSHGDLVFARDRWWITALLLSTGVVTAVPLIWFGHAARNLRLTTLGFLQYLAPTCSFLLGVFVYHEPFSRAHLITFTLIWLALVAFTVEAIARLRADRRSVVLAEAIVESPL